MIVLRVLAIASVMTVVSLFSDAWGDVVYTQPPQSPVVSIRASQFVTPPGAFNFQTFDNFSLNADTAVTDFHWRGAYFNTLLAPDATPTANSTGFGVNVYASSGALPGALLATETFTLAEVNETFVANQLVPAFNLTAAIFDYDIDLSTPLLATGGTTYWLSVFALSPPPSSTEAQWGWTGGTGGDGSSVQNGNVVNFDRAFSVTAVPEPSTFALLIGAILLLLGLRRRGDWSTPAA